MNKKYQIFVSSTFSDLEKARNEVMATILKMYHFPVGMELFSAADSDQWKIITKDIDSSDYYVLIIGHRYGSISPEDGISYTEKEYDYAKEKGVPILVFVRDRDAPTKPNERDNQEEKLNAFINKATGDGRIRDRWLEIPELCLKVQNALYKAFDENNRIGWTRGNFKSEEFAEEITNLNKEIRELRNENTELKAQIKEEKPIIEALFDSDSKIMLNIPTTFPGMLDKPKEFCNSDIPKELDEYITSEDIRNYNSKIPSQEIIDKYNDEKRLCFLRFNAKLLNIFIQNKGSCKANDVKVNIKFPDNVLVIAVEDKNNMDMPRSPLPLTPIEKAKRKIEEERKANSVFNFLNQSPSPLNLVHIQTPFDRINTSLKNLNRSKFLDIDGNTVEISIDKLLHTYGFNFDDIILVPIKEGIEQVKISVICEELKTREITYVELNVIKD